MSVTDVNDSSLNDSGEINRYKTTTTEHIYCTKFVHLGPRLRMYRRCDMNV